MEGFWLGEIGTRSEFSRFQLLWQSAMEVLWRMGSTEEVSKVIRRFRLEEKEKRKKENRGKREEKEIGTKEKEFAFSAFVRTQKG